VNHVLRAIHSRSALVLTVMALVLASFGTRAQQQKPSSGSAVTAPTGNAENGKKLYKSIGCWQCHGYSGQGGRAGPKLVPNPMPVAAFTKYVRAPGGDEMPPYTSKVVSDAQLADIYAFLKTIPPPRDVKEIPLLNQKEGSKQ
jgi:mono/diheme cytochrome c family protein